MAKKNVKEWIKEHKQDIRDMAWYTLGLAMGIGGYAIGNHIRHRNDVVVASDVIKQLLLDAEASFDHNMLFAYKHGTPLMPTELGELGKVMASTPDYDPEQGFTHFIAIGEAIKK